MSSVLAIMRRDGEAVKHSELGAMLSARSERGPDGTSSWLKGSVALAHQHFWLTPEEIGEQQPRVSADLVITADARLHNRKEVAQQLGLDMRALQEISDSQLILYSYRHWGQDCPQYLLGSFAFVIWDVEKQLLFAARDPLGMLELHYFVDSNLCVLASEISHILALPEIKHELNENRIAAYLSHGADRPGETFYQGIEWLPPAHSLTVTASRFRLDRYWSIDPYSRIRYRDHREYAEQYRELLTEAVRCRLRAHRKIGISMSGGLDSTAIGALAASHLAQSSSRQTRLPSFSYAFSELESCDERRYIRQVVDQYQLDPTYLPCDDCWPLRDLSTWPLSPDHVLADAFAGLPQAVMKAAEQSGVRLLLTGYYGDVLFTGGLYWALDMARDGQVAELSSTVLREHRWILWQYSFFEFGLRRLVPAELSAAYRRWRPRTPQRAAHWIDPDLIARTNLLERMSPSPAARKTWPPGIWERYQSIVSSTNSEGLASVRHQYNRHGIEIELPYYDKRLVEFVMAVPAYVLGRPAWDRLLHREAMTGVLPEEVRLRRDRTTFSPLVLKGLRDKEWGTVKRIMSDPQIVQRGFVRSDWIQERLASGYDLSTESAWFWKAICLELWLQRYWSY